MASLPRVFGGFWGWFGFNSDPGLIQRQIINIQGIH